MSERISMDAVASDDWILVPRTLSNEASRLLAYFDMDSIGNSPHDAADECWHHLLDMVGAEPPTLEFQNPVFNAGRNTTVRRGSRWHGRSWAKIRLGDGDVIVKLYPMTHDFYLLSDHWLRHEHDPACRTVDGLFAEMQRIYPGFKRHEEVTVIDFWLPCVVSEEGRNGITDSKNAG